MSLEVLRCKSPLNAKAAISRKRSRDGAARCRLKPGRITQLSLSGRVPYFGRTGCRRSKAEASALLAVECRFENNLKTGIINWRDSRAAAV